MRILTTAVTLLAATVLSAQQTPAAKTQPAAPATKSSTTSAKPAAKTAAAAKPAGALVLKTQKDKFSYALGMNLGMSLHKQSVEVDPNILAQGMKAALTGGKTLLTLQEAQAALMEVQNDVRQKQIAKLQALDAANKKEGDVFLATNKTKEGVVTQPSGLQYKILKEGTGAKPTASDTVVCNYRGTLLNGTEFDSSYKRNEPATFPLNGVIKGWTEALQLMPVGSKWQLFVPSTLAYGERGTPDGTIGPGSTLIFEVELLSIQEKPKAEETPKVEEKPKMDEKPKTEEKPPEVKPQGAEKK